MFKCHHCRYLVFTTTCPSCGQSREAQREAQATPGCGEFLPTVPYQPDARDPSPPQPFRKRLAEYLGCDESEVMLTQERPRSTVPLWMLHPLDTYHHGPKPWWMIRRILERIRRSVQM